jgi:hypothetical protein
MRDSYNSNKVTAVIAPQTQTNDSTAIVGAIIDHANYDSAMYVIHYGTMTDANATVVALLEESDDSGMSGATAVGDDDLLGTEAAAGAAAATDDLKIAKLGYKGSKRYTRLTLTPSGNDSGALPVAASVILAGARKQPTS